MPRHQGRHRKPRPPIVPTAALAGTGAAAVVFTVIAGGGSQAGFVDTHTLPSTIDPTPTSAATPSPDPLAVGPDHSSRSSVRVARSLGATQADSAQDTPGSVASTSRQSTPEGSGSTADQDAGTSQPPADDSPTLPLPSEAPAPTPSPSPSDDGPLPKLPQVPLPTPDLPSVDLQVSPG